MNRKPDNGLTIEQRTVMLHSVSDMVPKMVSKHRKRHDREDGEQQCYLNLWKATRTYVGDMDRFRQYASKVIANTLARLYHDNKRHSECDPLPYYVVDKSNPQSVVDMDDLFAFTMRRFYPAERRLIELFYVKGKTIAEIANEMGITIPKANKIRSRAIERLRWEEMQSIPVDNT